LTEACSCRQNQVCGWRYHPDFVGISFGQKDKKVGCRIGQILILSIRAAIIF